MDQTTKIQADFIATSMGFDKVVADAEAVKAATSDVGSSMESSSKGITSAKSVLQEYVAASLQTSRGMDGVVAAALAENMSLEQLKKTTTAMASEMKETGGSIQGASDGFAALSADTRDSTLVLEEYVAANLKARKGMDDVTATAMAQSMSQKELTESTLKASESSKKVSEGFDLMNGRTLMAIDIFMRIAAVIGQGIKAMADEQMQIQNTAMAFTTLTGSADKAAQSIANLNRSAAAKDFGAAAIDGAVKHLMLLGMSADKATQEVQTVANGIAAVGGSANQIQPVTDQLNKIQTESRVTKEEMDQLANSGLDSWKLLADGMGISVEQAEQRVKSGAVSGQQAFNTMMGQMQQYGGATEAQGQSLSAEWARFGDNMGKAFKPLADLLAKDLEAINDLIEGTSRASEAFRQLGQFIASLGTAGFGGLVGHATGIMNSPYGHIAEVGEQGKETMWIPAGASVFPSGTNPFDMLASMYGSGASSGSSDMGSLSLPSLSGSGSSQTITVVANLHLDSRIVAQQVIPHIAPMKRQLTGSRQ